MDRSPLVQIKSLSDKGFGISDTSRELEVLGAYPGEVVQISDRYIKKKKREIAFLEDVLERSCHRIEPTCKHFSKCGGCTFQTLDYIEELKYKHSKVKDLYPDQKVDSIVHLDKLTHYRSKMEFSFAEDRRGNKYLGLYEVHGKGKLLHIEECSLIDPIAMEIKERVYQWWHECNLKAYHYRSDKGTLRNLTIRKSTYTSGKMVVLTVSGNSDWGMKQAEIERFKEAAAIDADTSVYLILQVLQKRTKTKFFEMHLAGRDVIEEKIHLKESILKLEIAPQSFFQPSTLILEKMLKLAVDLVQPNNKMTLLDLYCGIGTFAIAFAPYVKQVIGIEINANAVWSARENVKRNQLTNIEIIREDATVFAKERLEENLCIDVIILDPPRSGLSDDIIRFIFALMPEKLLYVSCNPKTQKQDILQLEDRGYVIEKVQPFDQFPRTPHIENMIYLTLRS